MRRYLRKPGSLAAIAAAVLMLTPAAALGQRGASASTAEAESPESTAVELAPQSMERGQMQGAQRGQMRDRPGRSQGMQAGADLTERERLERMREHMVAGMRRMAVRLAAVQDRILALDRGEPDAAPPVEMGRGMRAEGGQGMQGMQMRGQGMRRGTQRRDGASECLRAPPNDENVDATPEGADR